MSSVTRAVDCTAPKDQLSRALLELYQKLNGAVTANVAQVMERIRQLAGMERQPFADEIEWLVKQLLLGHLLSPSEEPFGRYPRLNGVKCDTVNKHWDSVEALLSKPDFRYKFLTLKSNIVGKVPGVKTTIPTVFGREAESSCHVWQRVCERLTVSDDVRERGAQLLAEAADYRRAKKRGKRAWRMSGLGAMVLLGPSGPQSLLPDTEGSQDQSDCVVPPPRADASPLGPDQEFADLFQFDEKDLESVTEWLPW